MPTAATGQPPAAKGTKAANWTYLSTIQATYVVQDLHAIVVHLGGWNGGAITVLAPYFPRIKPLLFLTKKNAQIVEPITAKIRPVSRVI